MQIPSIGYQWQNYAKFCPIELFAAKKAQFEPVISNQDLYHNRTGTYCRDRCGNFVRRADKF